MRLRYGFLLSGAAAVLLTACTSGGGTAGSTPPSTSPVPDGPRTSATYTPKRAATEAELTETAAQLRKRATVLGLTAPMVGVSGGKITVSAVNTTDKDLAALTAQSELDFRPVLAVAPSIQSASSTPAAPAAGDTGVMTEGAVPAGLAEAFRALDCTAMEQRTDRQTAPTAEAVACSRNMATGGNYWEKLALGPVAVDGKNVKKAESSVDPRTGQWQVLLTFDDAGAKAFENVTARLATNQMPGNQFAILVDGLVVSHPAVLGPITGGSAVISGGFTQTEASQLAAQLTDHLTVGLTPAGTTTSG